MRPALVLALVLILTTVSCIIAIESASCFSPVENTWIQKAPMNTARSNLGVAAVDGKVYAIGGSTRSYNYGSFTGGVVSTNEQYNPESNTWVFKAPMPTPRMDFAIASDQGKIYCIGGVNGNGYVTANEVYDPATNSWEIKAPIPIPTRATATAVINGRIYVHQSANNNSVYDPLTDSWNTSVPTPTGDALILDYISNGYETSGVLAPEMIYTFVSSTVQAYNPQNESWTTGANNPIARNSFGVAVLNDTFYLIGGDNYTFAENYEPSALNQEYIPIGYGTIAPTVTITPSIQEFQPFTIIVATITTSVILILFTKRRKDPLNAEQMH